MEEIEKVAEFEDRTESGLEYTQRRHWNPCGGNYVTIGIKGYTFEVKDFIASAGGNRSATMYSGVLQKDIHSSGTMWCDEVEMVVKKAMDKLIEEGLVSFTEKEYDSAAELKTDWEYRTKWKHGEGD